MSCHRKASRKKIKFAKKLRRNQTRAERAFYNIAKEIKEETGIHFWSQSVMLGWIVDFWFPRAKVIVEIDGPSHKLQEASDAYRDSVIEDEVGAITLRFTNKEVLTNSAIVKSKLKRILLSRLSR